MKKILFLLLITALSGTYLYGQTENVGINTTSPDNSASLHVTYVTTPKGILIPRMDNTARGNIVSPANGLLIFNTSSNRFEVYDLAGTTWRGLLTNASVGNTTWSRTGNTGTTPGTDFIGTTDNTAFTLYTNNAERLRINANGNFGVGTNNPSALLSVGLTSQFQVAGTGAISAATGITSSGNIIFSSLPANQFVRTIASGQLSTFTFGQDLSVLGNGDATVIGIRGRNVSTAAPTNGQVLQWNNTATQWEPTTPTSGSGGSTLDESYDKGGAGAGRAMTVDAGAVQLTGSNAADETIEITTTGNGGLALLENTGTGNSLTVNDEASDTTPFTIDDEGNIGVKSSAPSASLDVAGDFKLGTDGTVITNIIKRTINIDVGNIGTNGANRIETVTFTGARENGVVSVSPSGSLGPKVFIGYAYVSNDDEIKIVFYHNDDTSYNPSSQDFHITVIN